MLLQEQNVVRRRRLVEIGQEISRLGFVKGTAGNASARASDGLLVTPSGITYADMKPNDVVHMKMDGEICYGRWMAQSHTAPSSEWHLHRALYEARPEVNAILHTHPPFTTTLAVLGKSLPAIHYLIGIVNGNEVPCAPYRTFGTKELSEAVVETMGSRRACLVDHHGLIAVASNLHDALELTIQIESLAELYWRACAIGTPTIIDDDEMERVRAKFEEINYGPK